jgi:hypothetical protein
VLVRAGEIKVTRGRRGPDEPCVRSRIGMDLPIAPGGLALRGTTGRRAEVLVRRFASGYEDGPVAILARSRSIFISAVPDAVTRPWYVRVSRPVIACT